METVVVGVDESEGGAAALEFAAGEAVFRGARLRIVSAWQILSLCTAPVSGLRRRCDLPAVHTGQSPLSPVNAGDLAEARWSRSR